MEQKNQESSKARHMRIASAIIGLYRPETIKPDEFDDAFRYVTEAGEYLARGFETLKRGHIASARGVAGAQRIINRAKAEIASGYGTSGYAANAMATLLQRMQRTQSRQPPPAIGELILDLEALERDFPKVEFTNNNLVVHTEPITLTYEGMSFDFRDFKIILDMKAVAAKAEKPYEVRALDPQYTPDRCYCHPHLTGYDLCEGDGRSAAWKAAAAGRVYDFFVIINQILNTYNPGSPYAKLEVWVKGSDQEHFMCWSCEESVSLDDRYVCECCGEAFCESCSSYCDNVDMAYCHTCINDGRCSEDCEYLGAQGCLEHENDVCFICNEIPPDHSREECSHAYRSSTYGVDGRNTNVSVCRSCLDGIEDEQRPCMLTHVGLDEVTGTRRVNVDTRCPHYGEEDCALVETGRIEEGATPEPQEDEAQAEQEVADAGTN